MNARLYALLLLVGTLGLIVLAYLYFFVFYTAVVVINSNVSEYTVEFFNPATAQKREEFCKEALCEILDVSPLEYTITFSKEDYETQTLSTKIQARKKQDFLVEFEKKARLEPLISAVSGSGETSQQKIQRLREENLYVASFALGSNEKITFTKEGERMLLHYRTSSEVRKIGDFALLPPENIFAEYIQTGKKVFLRLADTTHILDLSVGKLYTLPYEIPVIYIKPGISASKYLVVTENGTFSYDVGDKSSEFQYLFRDFIYFEDALIGVIYDDETQKKENFNLTQKGNLVMLYTQDNKRRKVLLATDLRIDRVRIEGEKVIVSAGESQYELQNF